VAEAGRTEITCEELTPNLMSILKKKSRLKSLKLRRSGGYRGTTTTDEGKKKEPLKELSYARGVSEVERGRQSPRVR